jgi:hypothetical protein
MILPGKRQTRATTFDTIFEPYLISFLMIIFTIFYRITEPTCLIDTVGELSFREKQAKMRSSSSINCD